jgi:hypothetical protein
MAKWINFSLFLLNTTANFEGNLTNLQLKRMRKSVRVSGLSNWSKIDGVSGRIVNFGCNLTTSLIIFTKVIRWQYKAVRNLTAVRFLPLRLRLNLQLAAVEADATA